MNERFINEVAVSLVFVQGPTEELTMTGAEILQAAAEVQEGRALLTGLEPDAEISWSEDYRTVELTQPIFPDAPWKGMPKDFYIRKIDAALWRESNNKIYFFQGHQYIRMTGTRMDGGYPKPIAGNWHGLPPEFEADIDAAFWRKSNGKIYLFKGDQYVRLTETQVDAGYPKPIAGNWHGLPASFEAGIDAAFMHAGNGKIYMFKGDEYVRFTGSTVDDDYPKPIKGNFKGVPDYYEEGITTALWRGDNERVYLFGRQSRNNLNTYVRFTDVTENVDSGYPTYVGGLDAGETEALWRDPAQVALGVAAGKDGYKQYVEQLVQELETDWGIVVFVTKYPTYWGAYANTPKIVMRWKVGEDNFDRVFAHETGHMFGAPDEYTSSECDCGESFGRFFDVKNGNCALCASTLSMGDGYPKSISGNWNGLPASFTSGIDAAFWRKSNGKIYLFKGDQYVRLTETTMDEGYPRAVSSWNGLPESWAGGIDAALMRLDSNQIYFFRGRRYVRYSSVPDGPDPGYPAWINKNWMPFPRG